MHPIGSICCSGIVLERADSTTSWALPTLLRGGGRQRASLCLPFQGFPGYGEKGHEMSRSFVTGFSSPHLALSPCLPQRLHQQQPLFNVCLELSTTREIKSPPLVGRQWCVCRSVRAKLKLQLRRNSCLACLSASADLGVHESMPVRVLAAGSRSSAAPEHV